MANRLANATSPYLLQHAENPVDWYEWGPEAFAEAKRRDAPILLSVGYAACHWCHVMARESFEDDQTAAEMNASFVNVKVDREERPDVDAVYMAATVALTGHGGWPMTVFLTPDGQVFHAGTYYPPTQRHQLPAFRQVLAAITQAWAQRRADVRGTGDRIAAALRSRQPAQLTGHPVPPSAQDLERAVRSLAQDYDQDRGGFGGAPKFPPSMVLEWLLRHAARTGVDEQGSSGALALQMASNTLRRMAFSGLYDQLEGGFARYAVDAGWVVPHFEKMLYDNAQLGRVYLHWWRLTADPVGRRVAEQTCDFVVQRLGTEEGGLASALDADTPVKGSAHGVEGLTYVWTPEQLIEALGPDDGRWVARIAGVGAAGTFEHGTSTLQLLLDVDGPEAAPADAERWRHVREVLRGVRASRPQPARDDKVVAAWNGLAVAALAEAGALLDRPDLLDVARRTAALLIGTHLVQGRLLRVSRGGRPGVPEAVLEDHADVVEGLLTLYAVTGERRWAEGARTLVHAILDRFVPRAQGGLRDTAVDATDPVLQRAAGDRPADPADNAYPSGPSAAAGALLTWASLTGDPRAHQVVELALDQVRRLAQSSPRFAGWGLAVAEAWVDGPREVAVVGPLDDQLTLALHRQALLGTAPGLVVALGSPAQPASVPLLEQRGLLDGRPAAYLCRGRVCDLPTNDALAVQRFAHGAT